MTAKGTPPDDVLPDGDPASIVRRAPFADSPYVGERGQSSQLRILEAALEVFGEVGYHGCGVNRITELSGLSRASFYQYFSSKEDLFRHLAGRVARELNASADALGPITGDLAGRQSFEDWLNRYSAIYDAYRPVFVTFQTAAASDATVATGAARVSNRSFTDVRTRIKGSPLTKKQVDDVVHLLFGTVSRLNRESELLASETDGAVDRARINRAYADVLHRVLFGPDVDVNIHTTKRRLAPMVTHDPFVTPGSPDDPDDAATFGPGAQLTRAQILEAGHQVFVERGYYATRVADIVQAAHVSHGAFYRYFDNKTDLFALLAARAGRRLDAALDDFPALFDGATAADTSAELREFLRHFADTRAQETAIFAMWIEAMSRDGGLRTMSSAVIERTRGRLARYLKPRGWGDPDAEAMVLLVFLDSMIAGPVVPKRIESVAQTIERGLLAGPAPGSSPAPAKATRAKKAASPRQR